MVKKVIWSKKAKVELAAILEYWADRNKSDTYSVKLYALLQEQLYLISEFPEIGRRADIQNVYVKVIKDYLIYYEIVNDDLFILTIRDSRRNPKTLKLK